MRFLKKYPRPKWTTYKHVSDNSMSECLSFGNCGILSVVCVLAPANSLFRGLKCLYAKKPKTKRSNKKKFNIVGQKAE